MRRPLLFNPSSRNSGKQGKLDSVNHGPAGFFYMAHVLQLIWVICQAASDWRWFSFREPGDYHCIVCTVLISYWTKLAIKTKREGLISDGGTKTIEKSQKTVIEVPAGGWLWHRQVWMSSASRNFFHRQKHLPIPADRSKWIKYRAVNWHLLRFFCSKFQSDSPCLISSCHLIFWIIFNSWRQHSILLDKRIFVRTDDKLHSILPVNA